jgi:hypothetical protein
VLDTGLLQEVFLEVTDSVWSTAFVSREGRMCFGVRIHNAHSQVGQGMIIDPIAVEIDGPHDGVSVDVVEVHKMGAGHPNSAVFLGLTAYILDQRTFSWAMESFGAKLSSELEPRREVAD